MSSLFKSSAERAREARRAQRKAFRQAENAIDDVKDRIAAMHKDATGQWEQARTARQQGDEAAVQRLLIGYRAQQVLMTKLEQKRWVFEQYFRKLEAAQSDRQFADALEQLNGVMQIDPERVADVFESAQDLLGEQVDADRFWEKLYHRETENAHGALEERIPSVAELDAQLGREAAAEVGAGAGRVAAALDARVGAARERVRGILDGNGK